MINQNIIANKQKLDDLFDQMRELRKLSNNQIESQWATYLCIRISGLLETSIRSIYSSYCENKRTHPNIARYIGYSLDSSRSQNMKPETILNLANSFNPVWRGEIENYLADLGRKEAIESVINIRNSAAHGGNTTITFHNAKEYYEKIWQVIQFINTQCTTG